MKNRSLPLFILAATCLSGCQTQQSSREDNIKPSDVDINSVDDINDSNINSFASAFFYKLKSYSSYKAVTEGSTHATGFLVDVTQTISATVIKGEYSYLSNESHSTMVNTSHVAYYKDNKAVYNDNGASYETSSIEDYLAKYGTYPFDNSIEGYLLNDGVIVTRETSDTDYRFKVKFDKDKCTTNVKIQMRQFGGLDSDPVFTKDTVMLITVKQDLTPVTLELSSYYSATKIIETNCHQNYVVTYSNFDEIIQIPNLDEVTSYFNE